MKTMNIYDAHVHYLWRNTLEDCSTGFKALREKGLKGMAVIIMGHHLFEPERCFDFIPHSYHQIVGRHFFADKKGMEVPAGNRFNGLDIFPYLDSRYITENEADLSRFKQAGFRGLKLLYVPDEDTTYGMVGWNKLFGKSGRDFEILTRRLIAQAVEFGWPVIFHADLRLHQDFARDILNTYDRHPFIFPHFGFSRKIMAALLEQFNHCYTDFSSLLPFMKKSPEAYQAFIKTYADQVLFGSDATLDWTDLIDDYIETVRAMIDDPILLKKIFQDNYLKIHQKKNSFRCSPES